MRVGLLEAGWTAIAKKRTAVAKNGLLLRKSGLPLRKKRTAVANRHRNGSPLFLLTT